MSFVLPLQCRPLFDAIHAVNRQECVFEKQSNIVRVSVGLSSSRYEHFAIATLALRDSGKLKFIVIENRNRKIVSANLAYIFQITFDDVEIWIQLRLTLTG